MKINRNRYSHNYKSTIFIDFQYQSINCYWLLLIIIDYYWFNQNYNKILERDWLSAAWFEH